MRWTLARWAASISAWERVSTAISSPTTTPATVSAQASLQRRTSTLTLTPPGRPCAHGTYPTHRAGQAGALYIIMSGRDGCVVSGRCRLTESWGGGGVMSHNDRLMQLMDCFISLMGCCVINGCPWIDVMELQLVFMLGMPCSQTFVTRLLLDLYDKSMLSLYIIIV